MKLCGFSPGTSVSRGVKKMESIIIGMFSTSSIGAARAAGRGSTARLN